MTDSANGEQALPGVRLTGGLQQGLPNFAPVLFMMLATMGWAGNYVVAAFTVGSVSPFDLTFFRWAIALVPLFVIAQLVEKPRWGAVFKRLPLLAFLSACGMLTYNLLLYQALRYTSAIDAALINALNPALIVLLAAILVGDKLSWRGIGGVVIGLVGVLIVITRGSPFAILTIGLTTGDLFMFGAILMWSLYTIYGRRLGGTPPIAATAVQALCTVVVMCPIALLNGVSWPAQPEPTMGLLFIGLIPSIISYVLWNMALRKLPASKAGSFLNMITVFTVVIGVALGHEFSSVQMLGGLLVFAGVYIAGSKNKGAASQDKAKPVPSLEVGDGSGHGPVAAGHDRQPLTLRSTPTPTKYKGKP